MTYHTLNSFQGKEIDHFEDMYGAVLESGYMVDEDGFKIVFKDGSTLKVTHDWRGQSAYFDLHHNG